MASSVRLAKCCAAASLCLKASPVVVPLTLSAGEWLLVLRDHHNDPRAPLADADAVRAALFVAVGRRSEPIPALRALPLHHTGWWFPCLRVDGACGSVVQRLLSSGASYCCLWSAGQRAGVFSMPCLAVTAAPNRARAH